MKWLCIINNSRHEIYELRNAEKKLLTLTYQPDPGTLRITANDDKRVFLIGREGFLRSRIVLRNEYGVRMGQLIYENSQENKGSIEVYDQRFNYSVQNDSPSKVTIYRNTEKLFECELPEISENTVTDSNHDLLILTLCWYMSVEVRKQQVKEYA